MTRLALALAVLLIAPALSHANTKQPCDLTVATSPANARIKATCVDARALATSLAQGKGYTVAVHSNACTLISGDTYDCVFAMRLGTTSTCHGTDRVRGHSRHPRLLHRHITGYACA